MRDFSITKNKGKLYNTKVTDSYGRKYQNYFETASEANDWVYYIWSKEDWFANVDNNKLLSRAIDECKEIDKSNNLRKIM